jgi:putative ABC transport system permease protein
MRSERWLFTIPLRLRSLFRRAQADQELDDELRDHVDQKTEEYVAKGLAPEEARRQALLEMGGIEKRKEECRDARRVNWIQDLAQDLQYAVRILRKSPGFTIVAVLTLAVGIGANTAIFSVVNGVILKPLPYPHPEQLVSVRLNAPGINWLDMPLGASDYLTFRNENRTFQDIGLYREDLANLTGIGKPERVRELQVTDTLLPILGVRPVVGRRFYRQDTLTGSPATAMLSYGYWQSKFGGNPEIIRRTIVLDGEPHQVIGVMPTNFHLLDESDAAVIVPLRFDPNKTYLGDFTYEGIARLKPGTTLAEADADEARMIPITLRSFPPYPGYSLEMFHKAGIGPDILPLKQVVIGNVSKLLFILMGGISMVLLIACANVANLLLVRTEGRRHELAIRAALGATSGRLAKGLFVESLTIGLMGGVLGLGLAYGALRMLVAIAPSSLPRLDEIGIDPKVLLFSLAAALFASLLSGFASVLKHAGVRLGAGLREIGGILGHTRERQCAQNSLVAVQIAMVFVLLVCGGLMLRSFRALTRVDPGFIRPDNLETFRVHFSSTDTQSSANVVRAEQEIARKITGLPGVTSVSFASSVPMDGERYLNPIYPEGREYQQGQITPMQHFNFVAPGYFQTMGIPLISGRDLTWSETYEMRPVALVSENLADEYWGSPANALGKRFRVASTDGWIRIIGVVGNVRIDGMDKPAPTCIYRPVLERREVAFAVRSPLVGSQSFLSEIRAVVSSVDANLPVANVHTLEFYYHQSVAQTSFTVVMLGIAGGMALLLGIVGLYGVIAYSVSRRAREIGIRMALGAQPLNILRLVLKRGTTLILIGLAAGIAFAVGLTRLLGSLLYDVKPTDPLTFILVSLFLTAVALAASYIPARRAMRVDPMVALRYE